MVLCRIAETNMDTLNSYIVLSMNPGQSVLIPNHVSSNLTNLTSEEIYNNYKLMPNSVLPHNSDLDKDNGTNMNRERSHSNIALETPDILTENITIERPSFENCSDEIVQYKEHEKTHENESLECNICYKSFSEMNAYNMHLSAHLDDEQFNCPICNTGFNIENNYKIHMALHGNSSVCPVCELSFQRKASLKSHLAIHQVEEYYKCPDCALEFEDVVNLRKHIKTHIRKDNNTPAKLICRYCKVQFDDARKLRKHVKDHMKIKELIVKAKKTRREESLKQGKKHRCNECDKSFPKFSLLQRHVRIHNGERPFMCPVCSNCFTQKVSLETHLLKHTGIKPYCCTLCPAKFFQKCNLKVHVEKTHSAKEEGEKKFKCSECVCIFKRLSSLNAHMRKAHADCDLITITTVIDQLKNLEKQLDGKSAEQNESKISKNKQNKPGDVHKVEKPVQENEVTQHFKVYSLKQKFNGTNKVYVCSYCSRETKKPSDMVRHIRTHTKEKPFKCHCGCSFAYKTTLQTHMKKHSGKKCEKCSKRITSSKQWKVHLRKHSQEESAESKNIGGSSDEADGALLNCLISLNNEVKTNTISRSHDSPSILKESEPKYMILGKVNSNSLLKRNILTEPYECPYCKEKFSDILLCRKHIDSHKTQEQQENKGNELSVTGWQDNISIASLFQKQLGTLQDTVVCDSSNFQLSDGTAADTIEKSVQALSPEKSTFNPHLVLDTKQNQNIQTILVSYPDVHSGELLTDFILSQSDNGIILETVGEKNGESPIIFNVQTINVTNENIIPEDIYAQEFREKSADPVLTMANQRSSPPLQSLDNCDQIDNGDRFLSNNVSLYPNSLINSEVRSEINPDKPTHDPHADNTIQLQITNEPQENVDLSVIGCLSCKKMFESLEPYLSHMKTCGSTTSEILEEKTKEPDKEVTTSTNVIQKSVTGPPRRNLYCVLCEKEFSNRGIYMKHINIQHGKKENGKHQCEFCFKEFKKFSDLVRHLRTHTGEKPFECDQCGKKFTLKSTLESHIRTHNPSSMKRYVCEVCNSFFTSNASRKLHMQRHTESKTHKCTYCDQLFRTAAHRKCHEMNIHLSTHKKKANKSSAKKITNILATAVDMAVNEIQNDNKVLEEKNSLTYPEIKVDSSGSKCDTEGVSIDPTLSQIQGPIIISHEMDQELLACARSAGGFVSDTIVVEDDNFAETHSVKNLFPVIEQDPLRISNEFHWKKCSQCNLCFLSNEELLNHEKTHPLKVSYSCFLCDVILFGIPQLNKHLRSVHGMMESTSQLMM